MSRRSLRDYIHDAFFARDKATLAQIVRDAEEDVPPWAKKEDNGGDNGNGNGNGNGKHAEPDGDEGDHHASNVHVHIEHGKGDDTGDSGKLVDRVTKLEDGFDKVAKSVDRMAKVLDAMGRANDEGTGTPVPPSKEGEDGDLTMTDPPGVDAELMEADPVPEQERMRMGDAAYTARRATGIAALLKDTVARAEVLVPGVKMPTWDSADGTQLSKQLCGLRRSVLVQVASSETGAAVLGNYAATVKTMSCDAVRFLFRDASDKRRALNNQRNQPSPMFGDHAANLRGYRNQQQAIIADINKRNNEYWAGRITSTRH